MSTPHAQRLLLRNELIKLDRLAAWIEGLADPGMSPNVSLAVQVCLEEVVANTAPARTSGCESPSNWNAPMKY